MTFDPDKLAEVIESAKPKVDSRVEIRDVEVGDRKLYVFDVYFANRPYPNFVSTEYATEDEARKASEAYLKTGKIDWYSSDEIEKLKEKMNSEASVQASTKEAEIKALTEKLALFEKNHDKACEANNELATKYEEIEAKLKESEDGKIKVSSELESLNFKIALEKKINETNEIAKQAWEKGIISEDADYVQDQLINKQRNSYEVHAEAERLAVTKLAKTLRSYDEKKIADYKNMLGAFSKTASFSKKAGKLKVGFTGQSEDVDDSPEKGIQDALRSRSGRQLRNV